MKDYPETPSQKLQKILNFFELLTVLMKTNSYKLPVDTSSLTTTQDLDKKVQAAPCNLGVKFLLHIGF